MMVKKDFMYEKDQSHDCKCPALSLDSWRQKQILNKLVGSARIKQAVQSYEVMDQRSW